VFVKHASGGRAHAPELFDRQALDEGQPPLRLAAAGPSSSLDDSVFTEAAERALRITDVGRDEGRERIGH
jgi:hypothetical protein